MSSEIDVKNCPCYIDRLLHRYDKGCLIQSQAFSEQQTKEKPILRCDEIVGCPIKEQYKQLQQLKAENDKLKSDLQEETRLGHKAICEEADRFLEVMKLEKILDEIEEICKESYTSTQKYYYNTSDIILQKIKEVKG